MNPLRTLFFATNALLCIAAVGCSSSSAGPQLAAADGTVTYQGHPLADATVLVAPEKGPVATGVTDLDGHFTLSTGSRRGVVVGPVHVAISAGQPASGGVAELPQPKTAEEARAYVEKAGQMQQAMMQQGGPQQPKSVIPPKYAKMDTSGLSYEVKASGDNHFDIQLQ
ncbi:MAG TPA: carboxypeptidase-like regulatory domain-containing protein [Planctomycetaceae bacterium]|nr:carboxypeptidase-like regulatory domain-containing protein [Planctomycetaceae bacterium]